MGTDEPEAGPAADLVRPPTGSVGGGGVVVASTSSTVRHGSWGAPLLNTREHLSAEGRDGRSPQRSPREPGSGYSPGESHIHGAAPMPATAGRHAHFTQARLIAFLMLHITAFSAELCGIIVFAITGDWWFFSALLLPFLFSGVFCAHAAWHCDAPNLAPRCLPLKRWPCLLAVLLAIPLGFGQGIIVLLSLEEFMVSKNPGRLPSLVLTNIDDASFAPAPRITVNKFHCKAVNGLFEGLLSSAAIMYALWSMGFPAKDPITKQRWSGEAALLSIIGLVQFFSSGLGLLEMDYCTSRTIAKRMRRGLRYEAMHWIFRTCEVISRGSMLIGFMLLTRKHLSWWWAPLAMDFLTTLLLVAWFGGSETTWLVRLLCSIPCSFADIFLFIDSPYKRCAARRLSRRLTLKNGVELFLLPLLAFVGLDRHELKVALIYFVDCHGSLNIAALISTPLYWLLLWWVCSSSIHRKNTVDIYAACESGSVHAVRTAIRDLTSSAAVRININCFGIDGRTPLMTAALRGHAKVCQLLLQEGARVNLRVFPGSGFRKIASLADRRRWTALHMAAWRGHAAAVRVLLANLETEDVDLFQDAIGETPLHVAAWAGHAETVQLLALAQPHWICAKSARGYCPRDVAKTEGLREALTSPEHFDDRGNSLLQPPSPVRSAYDLEIQAWPQVHLHIRRTSRQVQLIAPGLCSYIASSCGGALGRAFLTEMAQPERPSGLTSISEVDESFLKSVHGPSQPMASTAVPTVPQEPAPAIDDLEPVDCAGEPVQWWTSMVQIHRASNSGVGARSFVHIPEETVLGQGSYGLVWRARDKITRERYAVKNIKTPRSGAPSVASREFELAEQILLKPHPCIVRLHHVHNFADAGLYMLVMELCPGGDLLGRIRAAKRETRERSSPYFPPPHAHAWVGQVFLGLEHMHLRMHTLLRDLKPENVVLGASNQAKLTDFGFGRFGVESCGRWSFGIPTGSPGYVPPELLRKEAYDSRADLYSLGVLVWVLFTGGLATKTDPSPPLGRMRHERDFKAHFDDWLLLARCIADPERNEAQRLPEHARDFVARLTRRYPAQRICHREIRSHHFMEPLALPPADARPSMVKEWIESTHLRTQSEDPQDDASSNATLSPTSISSTLTLPPGVDGADSAPVQ